MVEKAASGNLLRAVGETFSVTTNLIPEIKQSELPLYTVRVSARSRRVWLKVTPADGLCVVIPRGFDPADIPALVAEKSKWIQRALLKVSNKTLPSPVEEIPQSLSLQALGEQWGISYQTSEQRTQLFEDEVKGQLIFQSKVSDPSSVHHHLRVWLRNRAKRVLPELTFVLADELGFKINRVTIRNQKSRWGSCSSKRNISLNLKLLFVTPAQLQYVLIHELCHTRQMNHSPKFWQLVEQFEPDTQSLRQSLRAAWSQIPAWV